MKNTFTRYAKALRAAVLAVGILAGFAAASFAGSAPANLAGGTNNGESCVSSVEYACPPPPPGGFPWL